jgi:hypothetical protein
VVETFRRKVAQVRGEGAGDLYMNDLLRAFQLDEHARLVVRLMLEAGRG